jgi:hypothetical protein
MVNIVIIRKFSNPENPWIESQDLGDPGIGFPKERFKYIT